MRWAYSTPHARCVLQQTGSLAREGCFKQVHVISPSRGEKKGSGGGKAKQGRRRRRGVPWLQGRREEGRPARGRGWNEWWAHLRLMLMLGRGNEMDPLQSRTSRASWALASSRRRTHSFQRETVVKMAACVQCELLSVRLPSASLVRPPTARCFPINRQPANSASARSEHAHCCLPRRRHLPQPPFPLSSFAILTLSVFVRPSLQPSLLLAH